MDQSTFTQLTGKTLSTAQASRFDTLRDLAADEMERLLGWPLNPSDWDNQYLERGKSKSDFACPDADTSDADLDSPDEPEGKTRVYKWQYPDKYLHIDPATAIHSVKFIADDITYYTFDGDDFRKQWQNGKITFTRFLSLLRGNFCNCGCDHRANGHTYQVSVDADWAFEPEVSEGEDPTTTLTLPLTLQMVWAELIKYQYNPKRNVQSESILGHSYTLKDERFEDQYAGQLAQYAGPNGAVTRPTLV